MEVEPKVSEENPACDAVCLIVDEFHSVTIVSREAGGVESGVFSKV